VLLGGVVVVERIFSWPGLGLVFFTALERSDYPVVLAWTALATVFVVLCNLAADVIYGFLDPRIRVGRRSSVSSADPAPAASPPEVAAS
jgi:ABC-type dipeptide/oligopeptide/nickel transport system permease component